ncbi:hypothetical protein K5V07_03900 [Flavobacterium sp. CHNK8]|uniref:hypothetical protein n=1 Tax=Flavobacterium sp. CHNK8 TaxID=2871165 RepID=UPI001C8DF32C|nr:hypothetical protein [Flavobacterium sp. CHNK8]QZK89676.1 hypothetical protein K5V07_03900 [Flavobacterium sp. CHNK8]
MEEQTTVENFDLQITTTAKDLLAETAKWAYYLSILGFIGVGFIVLIALILGITFAVVGSTSNSMGFLESSMGLGVAFVYILIGALYFFPIYYLNKFASNAKVAIKNSDTAALTLSFRYLKSHYKYIGIMTLVVFSLYVLLLVGMMFMGLFSSF